MNTEQLSKLLESIQAHIRVFDTKAQIALGLDSLLVGFVGVELGKGCELAAWDFHGKLIALLVTAALSLIVAILSALLAIVTIVPRLELRQPSSHFFFCHLAEMYGRDYERAAVSLIELSEEQVQRQIATQIQTNALIGEAKAARSSRALYLMTGAFSLYIISLVPFCLIAYHTDHGHTPTTPCSARRVEDPRDYETHRNYIHANPVEAHLCGRAEGFPWSSANPTFTADPVPDHLRA
jgi:hypothetical protein